MCIAEICNVKNEIIPSLLAFAHYSLVSFPQSKASNFLCTDMEAFADSHNGRMDDKVNGTGGDRKSNSSFFFYMETTSELFA